MKSCSWKLDAEPQEDARREVGPNPERRFDTTPYIALLVVTLV